MRPSTKHAFTLIELLVVISIIALLIAILLPTLKEVKRHAQVLTCMTQLQQIGVGMGTYASENNGEFPPSSSISVAIIYTLEVFNTFDNRQNLVDIAGGRAADLYFCPLTGNSPAGSVVDTEFAEDFVASGGFADRHSQDYNMFFLNIEASGVGWNWDHSGNPDIDSDGVPDAPIEWGQSEAVVIADSNVNWPTSANGGYPGDWNLPVWANHSVHVTTAPFRDSNVLYGDGHAILRSTLENYVERLFNAGFYPY